MGGVSGNKIVGCDAITVSRNSPEYREDDHFSWLRYSSNGHQGLRALYASWKQGKLVRVFRSSKLDNHFQASSSAKNHQLFRYDGLYKVTHVWNDKGEKDPSELPKRKLPLEYTFLLERSCCNENLLETDFFAECKRLESMPAFLEHTINWKEQPKEPATLPPIQPKDVPSSVTQVITSKAKAAWSILDGELRDAMPREPTEKKRKRGKKAAEASETAAKNAKKQSGGGGYSDHGNVSKPDDENETVASRNLLQRNSEFTLVKEDKSDGGSAGADIKNGAQVEATSPTRVQDYSKERSMVTPDGNKESTTTNYRGIPQNNNFAEIDNWGSCGMDEFMASPWQASLVDL